MDVNEIQIGADLPLVDPKDDAFGYAPFAARLADALINLTSPQGQVMAIHGPWGMGKSTFLNFVKHSLSNASDTKKPVVIEFNPWWFDGHVQLASQFLGQFRANLPHESDALRKIGDAIAEYSGSLGKVVAVGFGVPILDKPIGYVLKKLKRNPKDIPTLKKEVSSALTKAGKRFIIIIDDIDRLSPVEICEVFKVVKALADFPNVIYLLSFDRDVVAEALKVSMGIDGEAYLEKIVQAPFSLPAVDNLKIQQKLFKELDRILASNNVFTINPSYWANVFHAGVSQYIRKPRDIVRVINSLSITFAAACKEVNPVDFIALEVLRIFEPSVHAIIRNNGDRFTGHRAASTQQEKQSQLAFHNAWLDAVSESYRDGVKNLILRMFPKLDSVWGNTHYGADREKEWRRDLRVCSADIFPIYFQLGVPEDTLSRQELNILVSYGSNEDLIRHELLNAKDIRRANGSSKAKDYLTKLLDLGKDELSPEFTKSLLKALFQIGDELILPEDEVAGLFVIDSIYPVLWLVRHLVELLPEDEIDGILIDAVEKAQAIVITANVVNQINRHVDKGGDSQGEDSIYCKVSKDAAEKLKTLALDHIRATAQSMQLLEVPSLAFILTLWAAWGSKEEVSNWIRPIISSPELLLKLLAKYLQYGTRHILGDVAAQRVPFLNPQLLGDYVTLDELEPHVQALPWRVCCAGRSKAGNAP